MLYHKKGTPEEDEIVLCKVTKLFPNSVFVDLLEYNKQGMVHISEVSPGRIRNLRDFVSIDRQIVCKVLKIDQETGHIDLSLRRVNSNQQREKLDEIKQELRAEIIVKNVAEKLGKKLDEIYPIVSKKIFEEYAYLHLCFKDVAEDRVTLLKLGIDKVIADPLTEIIKEKLKPLKIYIKGEITITSHISNGVEKIKEALALVEAVSSTISLRYLGGGRFQFIIEEEDYKIAEKKLLKVQDVLDKFNKDKLSHAEFIREKSE